MPIHETERDGLIDRVNKEKCLVQFLDSPITYQTQQLDLVIDYYSVDDLPRELHEWAFQLVKTNLQDMYEKSKDGWNEEEKRKEMLAPQARYLIARSATDPNDIQGFLHFQMVQEETMDDDIWQIICCSYEIQIAESARGQGLGEYMMNLLSQIGMYWKMDKVMLTVFKANEGAFRFYIKKLGFKLDEISPGACLPLYKARKFDYELLSKPCI
ncbi:N-alpha-acetyltransferase 40-like protein [Mucor lusitanicus]